MTRDDFPKDVIKQLEQRVASRCSRPGCDQVTSGPAADTAKRINVGVAAHICAASRGGPRYDPTMTPEERRSQANGIWLCQTCAKLIDSDTGRYTPEKLRSWKQAAEARALEELLYRGSPPAVPASKASSLALATQLLDQAILEVPSISADKAVELEEVREAWREGNNEQAHRWLAQVRANEEQWSQLVPAVKADVLRFQAVVSLDGDPDLAMAKEFASQAWKTNPVSSRDARLQAIIAYTESGPETALVHLSGKEDNDTRNLKAAFLLDAGQQEEAEKWLAMDSPDLEPNAETYRLRALAALARKDIRGAANAIVRARKLKPRWEGVRWAEAVIQYLSALAPALLPDRHPAWPAPVPLMFVRQDDASRICLRRAEGIFQDIATTGSKTKEEARRIEAWQLACLAGDAGRQEEAATYCRELLRDDPAHYPAVVWAVATGQDVDLVPSQRELQKLVAEGASDFPCILALLHCHLALGEVSAATQLLADAKSVFEDSGEQALWAFWYAEALISAGEVQAALDTIDSAPPDRELRHVRVRALSVLAEETEDWDDLEAYLESCYRDTGDVRFLLDLCGLHAQQEDWEYVAERAQTLIHQVPTSEIVRFAVTAMYNAGDRTSCIELLELYGGFFPGGELPPDLRRLRVVCERATGRLLEAIKDLETLVHEDPTTADMVALAHLQYRKGDAKSVAVLARRLVTRPDLRAESSLGIAQLVRWEDPALATQLWKKAATLELPDEMVGVALILAFRMGLDGAGPSAEVDQLRERMMRLAAEGRGGAWMAPIEDWPDLFREMRERDLKLAESYRDGDAPIHLIAEQMGQPLILHYHGMLTLNQADPRPLMRPALLARYGGRPLGCFQDREDQWRLNLDVSAFLLAAHFGLLDAVEQAYAPLRIPPNLAAALYSMRERVDVAQPTVLEALRRLLALAETQTVNIVDTSDLVSETMPLAEELGIDRAALLEKVQESDGYVVTFLPLRRPLSSEAVSDLPAEVAQRMINCRSVVEALRQEGPLSERDYQAVLSALGDEGLQSPSTSVPRAGSVLYCSANTPTMLASAGVLEAAAELFHVFVEAREMERARDELAARERQQEISEWLGALSARVSKGIDDGTYELLPEAVDIPILSDGETPDPSVVCLLSLFSLEPEERDVVWVDDRFVTAFSHCNRAPIVSVIEILERLVKDGALDEQAYYDKLIQLRAANVRYIPLDAEEVLYHLHQALVRDGALVETQELRILRRYVAACLAQAEGLQLPPMPEKAPNPQGELDFLSSVNAAVSDALVHLWEDDKETNTLWAYAEWVWLHLRVSYPGLRSLGILPKREDTDDLFAALNIVDLVLSAIDFPPVSGEVENTPRRRYFEWLSWRVLDRRFEVDPDLARTAGDLLVQFLDGQAATFDDDAQPAVYAWQHAFFADLPEPLRSAVAQNGGYLAKLGAVVRKVITTEGVSFEEGDFFRAVGEAVNGRRATIVPFDGTQKITFEPWDDCPLPAGFAFTHPDNGDVCQVCRPEFALLSESPADWEDMLRQTRSWFDCPEEEFAQVVKDILATANPVERIEKTESWWASSAPLHYANVERVLQTQSSFGMVELLPPPAVGLLRHLRLAPDTGTANDFREALDEAARGLRDDVGLALAIDRFCSLPVPLPAFLVQAFRDIQPSERRSVVKKLASLPGTPLSRIHLVHLLVRCGEEGLLRLARRLIAVILGPSGIQECIAFLVLARWVSEIFSTQPDLRGLPAHLRLALVWLHCHRLFTVLSLCGMTPQWVTEELPNAPRDLPSDVFAPDVAYVNDVVHPKHIRILRLLLSGLSYAVDGATGDIWDDHVEELLHDIVFVDTESGAYLDLSLKFDSTLAQNKLGSFLGGDRAAALAPLLGDDAVKILSSESLRGLARQGLGQIDGSDQALDLLEWHELVAIANGLPLGGDVAAVLREAIHATDFAQLVELNARLGFGALRAAAQQAGHLDDEELHEHLADQLLRATAALVARKPAEDDARSLLLLPFDIAWVLVVASDTETEAVSAFADLALRLISRYPALAPMGTAAARRLCDELPLTQAEKLWGLLVQCRAM